MTIDKKEPENFNLTFERELQNRNYAKTTIKIYLKFLNEFLEFSRKNKLNPFDRITHFLGQYNKNTETEKQAYYAIKSFYKMVLNKKCPYKLDHIRMIHRRPDLLTHKEVEKLLASIPNKKHKLMISFLYSSGLRVSEVTKIKIKDINLENLTLTVKMSKQNKDRLTVISKQLKEPISKLIADRKQEDYLFLTMKNQKYNLRTVQAIFIKARNKAQLSKNYHCHSLRHSFATHLIEKGFDVHTVQELLGHRSSKTTMIYIHLANPAARRVISPL